MKVTKRNRQFGYFWTNSPIQTGHGLGFDIPDSVNEERTLASIRREREEVCCINSSNAWAEALYYGSRRVTNCSGFPSTMPGFVGLALYLLNADGYAEITTV